MNSLTWELCEFLPETDRKVLERAIFEVCGSRREHGVKSPNFEEFLNNLDPRSFTYLANCQIDLSKAGRVQSAEIALRGLREFIRGKCIQVQNHLGPYDKFVANLEQNASIVSFNWDVLLELSLSKAGKRFCYLPADGADSHTLILKPHGSINWFALLDRELLMIDTSSNVNVIGDSLKYYMLHLKDPLGPVEMGLSSPFAKSAISKVPAIIPPSSTKLLDVGGKTHDGFVDHGHREALCEVWKEFHQRIVAAEELVVIGYSLPGSDAASIEVLKTFCGGSKRRRVSIIDKCRHVLARYREIVHQNSTLVGEDFGSFDWVAFERAS
jgi:hypothetical protein